MENPVDELINGIIGGAEAGQSRREFKRVRNRAMELGNTNLAAAAKELRPPSFTSAVFRGFRDASLTPGQRLQAEQLQFANEARAVELGLKQREFNDSRQGLRDAVQLSDAISTVSDPREKLEILSRFPNLARTAPKVYSAMVNAAQEEYQTGIDMEKTKTALEAKSLSGMREKARFELLAEMTQLAPALADRYEATLANGDLEERKQTVAEFNVLKDDLRSKNGLLVETTSDGGMRVATGDAATDLTIGTKGNIQKQITSTRVALDALTKLQGALSKPDAERAVGIRGFVTDLRNGILAQANPNLFDESAGETRRLILLAKEAAIRAVSADDRFSNQDRAALDNIFASLKVTESLPGARQAIDKVVDILESKAGVLGNTLESGTNAPETITLDDGTVVRLKK